MFHKLQFPSVFNLILWSLTTLISLWFKIMYFITEVFIYSAVFKGNYLIKQKLKYFLLSMAPFQCSLGSEKQEDCPVSWCCCLENLTTTPGNCMHRKPLKKPFGALRLFTQEPDGKKAAQKSLFSVCSLHHSA